MTRAIIIIGSAVLLIGLHLWTSLSMNQQDAEQHERKNPIESKQSATQEPRSSFSDISDESAKHSPMSTQLASDTGSVEQDLKALSKILGYTLLEAERSLPTGTNQEITKKLTTPDAYGLAAIPANHPAINRTGELVDRWRTPYFFHALSSEKMEIRSAGPDKQIYTEDDLIESPLEAKPYRTEAQVEEIDLGL